MKKRFPALYILLISAVLVLKAQPRYCVSVPFGDAAPPKREVRAVWLTTIGGLDWPHVYSRGTKEAISAQKKELTDILDKLQRAGINTVLLQTRIRGTVIYPSAYEPWDGCLSGIPGAGPGYDALAFAVEECHKRGMELHAWVVAIPVGKWNAKGCAELRKKYPSLIKKIGEDGYMDPENPKTGDYIAEICAEIVRNYDVDGIHLDYIRYPETWKIKVSKERGRQYITDIVRRVNVRVKGQKKWVKLSCSPVGKYNDLPRQTSRGWNAYSRVCQDAQGWLRSGLMDALFPMMYFRGENFFPFALDWREHDCGRIVAPGLGIYFMSPKEKNWSLETITREMSVLRNFGMGHSFFRSEFLTDDTKGIYSFTSKDFNRTYALPPAMTWEMKNIPSAPQILSVDSLAGTLSWGGAKDNGDSPYLVYNIYCSGEYPVDVSDARNLVLPRTRKRVVRVPLEGAYYAVTAMDRYGNESSPIQQSGVVLRESGSRGRAVGYSVPVLECDGKRLKTGGAQINGSDLLQIETLQGGAVKDVFNSRNIDVSDIPEGVYILRSIGRKGVTHRIGFFRIER